MGTHTPEEIAAIPGAISSAELFSQAVKTGKKVKYYVLCRRDISKRILIRYITPNGNMTNGKGRRYTAFNQRVPRFLNYWHAYAYHCKLEQQKGEV